MAKKKAPSKSNSKDASNADNTPEGGPEFEVALLELENIVGRLEVGSGTLGEALTDYEQAIGLIKSCHKQLNHAERRIAILSGIDADGNPITEPLAESDSDDLEEKRASRSRRRSSKPSDSAVIQEGQSDGELF
ncbi:MAG: exodeoxyribonuclease VII small subunit [Pirellulaceae bacterium]